MVLDHDPTIKALFLSATPINTSPKEVIDLGNLIQPPQKKLNKDDFFDNEDKLKPGALEKIAEIFRGKVAYISDNNPKYFAEQYFVGKPIPKIDYLKFIRCPMTEFHYNTYSQVYTGVLAQDAQYLMDIAFPNPSGPKELGLYKTNDIKRALSYVKDDWYQKYGFRYSDESGITGHGLLLENLKLWSSKFTKVVEDCIELLKNPFSGKIFIYHEVVHISGVIFLEQIFQSNGFIA